MSLLRLIGLVSLAFILLFSLAAQSQPLDDTFGTVDLDPDSSHVLACTQVSLTLDISVTDARVFDLHIGFDPARLQYVSAVNGLEPTLNVMPLSVVGDEITVDAFFHPNFTGATNVITLTFYVNPTIGDDTTVVRFDFGQGYSGTADNPEPIQWSGDSAIIYIEGTPPEPPSEVLLVRQPYPSTDDSIEVIWNPVFYDLDGDTLINPLYVVFREDIINTPYVYDSIGATYDTFFYDNYINLTFQPGDTGIVNAATIKVLTRKTQP